MLELVRPGERERSDYLVLDDPDITSAEEFRLLVENNPKGPSTGTHRISRAGCWLSDPPHTRSAVRIEHTPVERVFSLGVRIAVTLPRE